MNYDISKSLELLSQWRNATDPTTSHHCEKNQIAAWSVPRHATVSQIDTCKVIVELRWACNHCSCKRNVLISVLCVAKLKWSHVRLKQSLRHKKASLSSLSSSTAQILDRQIVLCLLYWQIIDVSTNYATISFISTSPFTNTQKYRQQTASLFLSSISESYIIKDGRINLPHGYLRMPVQKCIHCRTHLWRSN